MDIVVKPHAPYAPCGMLAFGERRYTCVLGRAGIRPNKQEGDGATPVGSFPLRRVLYRADRMEAPKTALPVAAISRTDGWCDAPDDANYNRPVTLPYPARAESMWREDGLYDLVVVLGHNDSPVVPGAGSAIFLHVMPENNGTTAGCVALARDDLLDLLSHVDTATSITIHPR